MSAPLLVEMAWKSTILALAVLALLALMRKHSASHRAAVGGLGLLVLAVLPFALIAAPALPVPSIDLQAPTAAVRAAPVTMDQGAVLFPLAIPDPAPKPAIAISVETLAATLWMAGALAVLLRLFAGLLTLRRWTAQAQPIRSPQWTRLLRDCGAPDGAELLGSNKAAAPLSWGWRRPAILVDYATLADPAEASAVIAHEAAHLRRLDWPRLLAARLAVALFWFNPLVWLLERRHLQDIEEAADAEATRRVEPSHYAQTLLNVARGQTAPVGANNMACGTLSKRIHQILNPRVVSPREHIWRSSALVGVAMIAAPVALTQFVSPGVAVAAVKQATAAAQPIPVAPVASVQPAHTVAVQPASIAAVTAVQAAPQAAARGSLVDREELDRIMKDAEAARAHAEVAARDAEHIAARARAEVATQMANMRQDMLRGADDMERGAVQMREGAADMREEARKLRDPAYRAQQIAKARARGDRDVPTDQELIDAIPKMLRGADQMEAGVEKMRKGAQKMREQAAKS